jgi:hypothetical protein
MDVTITDRGNRKGRRRADQHDPAPAQLLASNPTYEDIARRAYELFVERGGQHGGDVDDWLRAERELATSARVTRFSES